MEKQHTFLYETCAKFTYFLMHTFSTWKDDLFLNGINTMIRQEKSILKIHNSSDFNEKLMTELKRLKTNYKEHLDTIRSNKEDSTLSEIYGLIKSVNNISMVKIQLDVIRQYQQILVKNSQYVVDVNKTHLE